MCLYNRLIRNPKYGKTKKNGGIIPPVLDKRVLWVPIGCNKCIECMKQKENGWRVRLMEDIKKNRNGKFVTLTFSNEEIRKLAEECEGFEGYRLDNEIARIATRRFFERWRKKYKTSARHWLITELGGNGTENIHMHGIIWTDETMETIEKIWGYGYMYKEKKKNYVNGSTINYIVKYLSKRDIKHKYYEPKIFNSAGIGGGYEKTYTAKRHKFNESDTKEGYRTNTGHEIALPIYYRNKLYTDEEREALWLHKLDKNERWVCGEKVKGDRHEEYRKLVNYHRKRNKRLGYGSYITKTSDKEYEENRRKMMHEQRGIKTIRNTCGMAKITSATLPYPKEWDN